MNASTQHSDDFATPYEAAADQLFERIEQACEREQAWVAGLRSAVADVLAHFTRCPDLARLLLFAPYDAGRQAQLRHEANLARLAALLRACRQHAGVRPIPNMVEEGLIGSARFIVGREIRAERADRLPGLAPDLTALLLTPYLGRDQAVRIAAGGLLNAPA